uniref:N5-glutamine methyltransferase family protein n=1 Tax=Nocardioides sp. TaxID=35761 RepID=UPI003517864B
MSGARSLLRGAGERLARAGVASPDADAAWLLAHVLGVSRGALMLVDVVAADDADRFEQLLVRRCAREPLQHLLGTAAFRTVELAVGPGVFVPRPETELLAGWAIEAAAGLERPLVLDLCTGSGAIAAAVAAEAPHARVVAVELDPGALAWAE